MKPATTKTLIAGLALIAAIVACGGSEAASQPDFQATLNAQAALTASAPPPPTADTNATVNAAIASTNAAATSVQATIDAGVSGTSGAAPTQTPYVVTTLVPITSAPTATPVDGTTLSEEELAALIDEAVNEAVAASTAATTATTTATSDDTLTTEEVQTVEVYVQASEDQIAEAEALIAEYNELYSELATESLATVQAMEEDLNAIAANTAAIDEDLQAIESTLNQGLTLATDTINQLEAAATTAQASAAELQTQAQSWMTTVQAELNSRATTALNVQPNQVANNPKDTIESAHQYVDAVKGGLADGRITNTELTNIAQAGANANASIGQHGGPQMANTPNSINNVTTQLARGDVPAARGSVDSLETSLPARGSGRP